MPTMRIAIQALRRTASTPKLLLLVWLVNILAATPLALAVGKAIQDDVGASQVHTELRDGFSTAWQAEYEHRTRGVGALFDPVRGGRGLVLENLDGWFSGELFHGSPVLFALALVYALWWIFAQGAILTQARLRSERLTFERLFAGGGRHFFSLAQVAGIGLLVYYGLYRAASKSFGRLDEAFRGQGTERELLIRVLILGALFLAVLHFVRLVLDYAKAATVADEIRFAPIALWRGVRFVLARPMSTVGLYLIMGLATLACLVGWFLLAPGHGASTSSAVLATFAASQILVAGRLFVRVAWLGAELALYQDRGGL